MQGLTHISHSVPQYMTDYLEQQCPHRIQRVWEPYDPEAWNLLLKEVYKSFGRPGNRWHWRHTNPPDWKTVNGDNCWSVEFAFAEESDLIMFALKY